MCHMQMAEASEQAFTTFLNGIAAARDESVSCADALQQQHALVTRSSQANAKSVFLSPPANLAPEHAEILHALGSCLLDLGHLPAAESILQTVDIINAKGLP
jgi:thioredoxin-like negative regulator of GroEL